MPEYTTAAQESKIVSDGYVPYVEGLNTRKSWEFFERATKVIPGGASSHARCWSYFGMPYPLNFVRGKGSKIWDADGNEYIDFCMAMGPDILGHAHPAVFDTIRAARPGPHYVRGDR